jgi:hypothetical protein
MPPAAALAIKIQQCQLALSHSAASCSIQQHMAWDLAHCWHPATLLSLPLLMVLPALLNLSH